MQCKLGIRSELFTAVNNFDSQIGAAIEHLYDAKVKQIFEARESPPTRLRRGDRIFEPNFDISYHHILIHTSQSLSVLLPSRRRRKTCATVICRKTKITVLCLEVFDNACNFE